MRWRKRSSINLSPITDSNVTGTPSNNIMENHSTTTSSNNNNHNHTGRTFEISSTLSNIKNHVSYYNNSNNNKQDKNGSAFGNPSLLSTNHSISILSSRDESKKKNAAYLSKQGVYGYNNHQQQQQQQQPQPTKNKLIRDGGRPIKTPTSRELRSQWATMFNA